MLAVRRRSRQEADGPAPRTDDATGTAAADASGAQLPAEAPVVAVDLPDAAAPAAPAPPPVAPPQSRRSVPVRSAEDLSPAELHEVLVMFSRLSLLCDQLALSATAMFASVCSVSLDVTSLREVPEGSPHAVLEVSGFALLHGGLDTSLPTVRLELVLRPDGLVFFHGGAVADPARFASALRDLSRARTPQP